jgi:hypothetical protein
MRQPRSDVVVGGVISDGEDSDEEDEEEESCDGVDKDDTATAVTTEAAAAITPIQTPTSGFSASTIVNEWDVTAIADVLFKFGEERKSRQIAREIVMNRPLKSTKELEWIIGKKATFKDRPKVLARYVGTAVAMLSLFVLL